MGVVWGTIVGGHEYQLELCRLPRISFQGQPQNELARLGAAYGKGLACYVFPSRVSIGYHAPCENHAGYLLLSGDLRPQIHTSRKVPQDVWTDPAQADALTPKPSSSSASPPLIIRPRTHEIPRSVGKMKEAHEERNMRREKATFNFPCPVTTINKNNRLPQPTVQPLALFLHPAKAKKDIPLPTTTALLWQKEKTFPFEYPRRLRPREETLNDKLKKAKRRNTNTRMPQLMFFPSSLR